MLLYIRYMVKIIWIFTVPISRFKRVLIKKCKEGIPKILPHFLCQWSKSLQTLIFLRLNPILMLTVSFFFRLLFVIENVECISVSFPLPHKSHFVLFCDKLRKSNYNVIFQKLNSLSYPCHPSPPTPPSFPHSLN